MALWLLLNVASGVAPTLEYRKTYVDCEDFAGNTDFKHQTMPPFMIPTRFIQIDDDLISKNRQTKIR